MVKFFTNYITPILVVLCGLFITSTSQAGDRLLATGGVTQIEGSAGGGLVPWALISGYATQDQIGGSAFFTKARTGGGFDLQTGGVSVGFNNRVEISAS